MNLTIEFFMTIFSLRGPLMYRTALFSTKSYDKKHFEAILEDKRFKNYEISFFENKLDKHTAIMAKEFDAVVPFVNDVIDKETIDTLVNEKVKLIAMRCAGFNNVDIGYAKDKIPVCTVPSYSPHSVAEHAFAMLMTLTRNLQHSYVRVREFNFSLSGLEGTTLFGKTIGIIGFGRIGKVMADIAKGFKMNVLVYDNYAQDNPSVKFVDLETLLKESDIITLHCPLTDKTYHLIDSKAISTMKDHAVIINTSRGALIDSASLLKNLKNGKLKGACLDVYEEENNLFYSDLSTEIIQDDIISRLISLPNVLVSGHQAFLTTEALDQIALTTMGNIKSFLEDGILLNEVPIKMH